MPTREQYLGYLQLPQVKAVLDMIAWAEGADYNVKFGGGHFSGNQHPNDCIPYGSTCSTAAGRYQFLYSTWASLGLPDFSPQNQDIGALMLIQRRGALDEILNGDIEGALRSSALGKEWASLPFSPYGQTNRTLASVLSYYNNALAVYGGAASIGNSLASALPSSSNMIYYAAAFVVLFLLIDG